MSRDQLIFRVRHLRQTLWEFGGGFQITIVRSNTDVIYLVSNEGLDYITLIIWYMMTKWSTILSLILRVPKAEKTRQISAHFSLESMSFFFNFSCLNVVMIHPKLGGGIHLWKVRTARAKHIRTPSFIHVFVHDHIKEANQNVIKLKEYGVCPCPEIKFEVFCFLDKWLD